MQLKMYLNPSEVEALSKGESINLGECVLVKPHVELILIPRTNANDETRKT